MVIFYCKVPAMAFILTDVIYNVSLLKRDIVYPFVQGVYSFYQVGNDRFKTL